MTIVTPTDMTGVTTPKEPVKAAVAEQPRQPDNVEAAPEVKADPLSPKFAALAKKERAIREAARQLAAEKEAIKKQSEEISSVKGWKEKLTQDPLSVLTEAGISYDQLTQLLLSNPNQGDPELLKIKQELQAMKSAQEQSLTRQQKQQAEQYEQAKRQMALDAKAIIGNSEEFETIKAAGDDAINAIVELIEHDYHQTGVVKDLYEVAKEVEEVLFEQELERVKKLSGLKKFQSKLNPQPPAEVEPKQEPTQKQTTPTLSNKMAPASKPLTAKERRERAIAAFLGQQT